jgi:transcriptional regulator
MYRPSHYDESKLEVLHALIRANPFATLVLSDGVEAIANHVPVLLRVGSAPEGQLVGHIARANPAWKIAKTGARSLLIFQGGDHYVSPRWYKSGQVDRNVVPTWDYAVVHARGSIEWIEDKVWLEQLLADMATAYEQSDNPWRMTEMSADRRDLMLTHIVGFQVSNIELQGKFKLNQGSSAEDRAAIVSELERLGTDAAMKMAAAIKVATSKARHD